MEWVRKSSESVDYVFVLGSNENWECRNRIVGFPEWKSGTSWIPESILSVEHLSNPELVIKCIINNCIFS